MAQLGDAERPLPTTQGPAQDVLPPAPAALAASERSSLRDVEQLGLFAALASLGYVFWLTRVLYESHEVGRMWIVMGVVGIVTALGIWAYGRAVLRVTQQARQ